MTREPAQLRKALQKKAVNFFVGCPRPFIADAFLHSITNSGKQMYSSKNPFLARHHPRLSHFREQGEARVIGDPVIHAVDGSWTDGALQAGASRADTQKMISAKRGDAEFAEETAKFWI